VRVKRYSAADDDGLAQHRMRRHLQALTAWWH
jgi:hypothetical protein